MATDPEFYGSLFLSLKEPFEVNKILSTGKFQIVPDGYGNKKFEIFSLWLKCYLESDKNHQKIKLIKKKIILIFGHAFYVWIFSSR